MNIKIKKFLIILLSIIVVIVLIFLYRKTQLNSYYIGNNATSTIKIDKNTALNDLKDTDGDGLFNWEEKLWGTNPESKDSNNDGVDDFTAIENIKKLSDIKTNTDTNSPEYKEYIALQNDFKFNFDLQSLTQNTNTEIETARQKELRDYGNTLGKTLKEILIKTPYEFEVLNSIISASTTKSMGGMSEIADRYTSLENSIKNIKTPSETVIISQRLISQYKNRASVIKELSSFERLSEIPESSWKKNNDSVSEISSTLISLMKIFAISKIYFKESEDGYMFNIPE